MKWSSHSVRCPQTPVNGKGYLGIKVRHPVSPQSHTQSHQDHPGGKGIFFICKHSSKVYITVYFFNFHWHATDTYFRSAEGQWQLHADLRPCGDQGSPNSWVIQGPTVYARVYLPWSMLFLLKQLDTFQEIAQLTNIKSLWEQISYSFPKFSISVNVLLPPALFLLHDQMTLLLFYILLISSSYNNLIFLHMRKTNLMHFNKRVERAVRHLIAMLILIRLEITQWAGDCI